MKAGGLRLKQYGLRPLGPEGAQDSTREAAILKALQAFIVENGVKSKVVNVCAPGFPRLLEIRKTASGRSQQSRSDNSVRSSAETFHSRSPK
jgi:hypothetical protein